MNEANNEGRRLVGPLNSSVSFAQIREANQKRLPQFRNKHGELAHSKPDGSDWSPAMWLLATLGELGEWAELRNQYEMGDLTYEEYCAKAPKELADVQTYLDILGMRALDKTQRVHGGSGPQAVMFLVETLGKFCNQLKKFHRGDIDLEELSTEFKTFFSTVQMDTSSLARTAHLKRVEQVVEAHPIGVDMGQAVVEKFNEVSLRVGCKVFITESNLVIDEAQRG